MAASQAGISVKEDEDEADGIADSMGQDRYPEVAPTQKVSNDWNERKNSNIDHASNPLVVMR